MANQLDRLAEGLAQTPTLLASVERLIGNVVRELAGSGSAQAEALAQSLGAHATTLGHLVLAGTPMIAATPPVHPDPRGGEPTAEAGVDETDTAAAGGPGDGEGDDDPNADAPHLRKDGQPDERFK